MSKSKKTKNLDKKKSEKSLPDMSPNLSEMIAFLQEEERKQYAGGGFAFGRKAGGFGKGMDKSFSTDTGVSLDGAAGGAGAGMNPNLKAGLISAGIQGASALGGMAIDNAFQGDRGFEHVGGATAGGALEGAATGAGLGAIGGPMGMAIGAGVGAIGGGIASHLGAKSANEAHRKRMEASQGAYDDSGIKRMMEHGGSMEQMPAMPEGNGDLNINHYEGNKHENGGIPLGDDTEVEAGETRVEDYIFSDKLTLGDTGKTFAELAKKIEKKYDRKDDPATTRALKKEFQKLITLNEASRMEAEAADRKMMEENIMAYGGYKKKKKMYDNGGEYAGGLKLMDEVDNAKLPKYSGELMLMDEVDDANLVIPGYAGGLELMDETDNSSLYFAGDNYVESPRNKSVADIDFTADNYVQGPNNKALDLPKIDPKKKNKFGAPEIGAIASGLPAMANLVMGAKGPANTEFEKVTPQTISLQKQRDLAGRDTAVARSIARENARGSGSSGAALSRMAAANSALTEGKIRGDLQSYLQEESMNTRIRNQADQTNTDIRNREIIANEQNAAAADKFRGTGLADLANVAQGYTKDKSLFAENDRYNKQVLGAINASFPNYKWGKNPETDEMMIQFATNQMRNDG